MSDPIEIAGNVSGAYGLEWSDASILFLLARYIQEQGNADAFASFAEDAAAAELDEIEADSSLTKDDIQAYISSRAARCPYRDCGSGNLEAGRREFDAENTISQEIHCSNCGRTWSDIYTLTGVEEIG